MKCCDNEWEKILWQKKELVLGIDEAGCGPLAGPLYVAGVIFPIGYENNEIYDSKALSEKKREKLFLEIKDKALWYKILEISVEVIDQKNIYQATKDAMLEIAESAPCQYVLTDAMPLTSTKSVEAIIKGDQKSFSIAAASILAKVTRDHKMIAIDKLYPGYGLAKNKGYPTKEHRLALAKLGITPYHRKSYAPVKQIIQKGIN